MTYRKGQRTECACVLWEGPLWERIACYTFRFLHWSSLTFSSAAGFNNFRNSFRKLAIFPIDLKVNKLCWGWFIPVLSNSRDLSQVVWGQPKHIPGVKVFSTLNMTNRQGQGQGLWTQRKKAITTNKHVWPLQRGSNTQTFIKYLFPLEADY